MDALHCDPVVIETLIILTVTAQSVLSGGIKTGVIPDVRSAVAHWSSASCRHVKGIVRKVISDLRRKRTHDQTYRLIVSAG